MSNGNQAAGPADLPARAPTRGTFGDRGDRILRQVDTMEAVRLLASVRFGRVVFTARALPAIRPINHLVDGATLVMRTDPQSELAWAVGYRGTVVAYEADDIDPDAGLGWSVIVTGVARPVTDPDQAADYRSRLRSWIGQGTDLVITMDLEVVSGLRLSMP